MLKNREFIEWLRNNAYLCSLKKYDNYYVLLRLRNGICNRIMVDYVLKLILLVE